MSWGRLGASWAVLERLDRVLKRKRASAVGSTELAGARGKHNIFEEENLQTSTDPLTTDADTQLGRFGPGADPKRSKAAYPPPRCVLDYKLNGSILSCKYTT